jgi:IclR family KDG regulon transcriptional repressor
MRHGAVLHSDTSTTLTGRPPTKSAVRVLDIFEALAASPDGLGFSDLGRRLGLPKSSLHGLLAALTDRGYVVFDANQRTYVLGIRVWELGQAYSFHRDLLREARRVMEGIVAEVNETVQLATLDGTDNVYLDKVDCSHPIRLLSEVGKRLPAHATGLGKVLLAQLPPETVRSRLTGRALPAFTPRTITGRSSLLAELKTIRQQGFAVDDQEYTDGLRCVAVPICEHGGHATTALSASVPIMRASPEQLAQALRAVAAGSLELSRRLGVGEEDPCLRDLTKATAEMVAARLKGADGPREEVRPRKA